ncbi:MAG: rod shape-determining protein MreD [Chitinophagia bacterium]|nr:rod shape-determining protein MreD [Chitinophagia bacterium]
MNPYIKNLFRFVIILAIQVLLLGNITLYLLPQPAGSLFIPLIYPLFILMLPFETPVWILLFLGFFMGAAVDAFYTTGGMHAAAAVLIAYLRTNVLQTLMPHKLDEYAGLQPSVKNMGWLPFLVYAAFLILIHHIFFFTLESWSFSSFPTLALKIGASLGTSMLFVVAYALLFTKQYAAR